MSLFVSTRHVEVADLDNTRCDDRAVVHHNLQEATQLPPRICRINSLADNRSLQCCSFEVRLDYGDLSCGSSELRDVCLLLQQSHLVCILEICIVQRIQAERRRNHTSSRELPCFQLIPRRQDHFSTLTASCSVFIGW